MIAQLMVQPLLNRNPEIARRAGLAILLVRIEYCCGTRPYNLLKKEEKRMEY